MSEDQSHNDGLNPDLGVDDIQEGAAFVDNLQTPLIQRTGTQTGAQTTGSVTGLALRSRIQGMGTPLPGLSQGLSSTFDAVRRGLGSGFNIWNQDHSATVG